MNMYFFCMIFPFLVKMPMFMVHLWLPKAHVEAPISGSMILASILLKLGGYGMLRLMMLFLEEVKLFSVIFISISLIGEFIVSLICIIQIDIKMLIAYSSVVHMGLVLSGIMTLSIWGLNGSLIMMIGHGLCSSGLFCLANISYERLNSRSLMINKGMLNYMPWMSLLWFLLCSSNMSAPPSLNLLGEVFLISSLVFWSWLSILFIFLMSFFSFLYSIYLYSYTQHGKIYSGMYSYLSGYIREYLLLLFHWMPLNLLIIKGEIFFGFI